MANVELPTVGLFFTLGNIIPPFRDTAGCLEVVPLPCGIAFKLGAIEADSEFVLTVFMLLLLNAVCCVVVDGKVVTGKGGSVNSSNIEYLEKHYKYVKIINTFVDTSVLM